MNDLSDAILAFLTTKQSRTYRNSPIANPTYPYVVFTMADTTDTYPSDDVLVSIMVCDKRDASCRAIETLADSIDKDLNLKVISNTTLNAHFVKSLRQYENDETLAGVQFVNLQYSARLYRKG